jgi:hypothetical protein
MVYKHRTKSGKVRHFGNKRAYEDSLKGMFAKDYQKKDHSKKLQKVKPKKAKKQIPSNTNQISHRVKLQE